MDLHHLKKDHLNIIELFHTHNKPLIIYGLPGCGKTTLALELLKNTILLQIDAHSLKNHKNIEEYILNSLKKRNITLMFNQVNEQRGLLIDDIHLFNKLDKSGYKSIIHFFNNKQFYNSKIIITTINSFMKNKHLLKIDKYTLELNYNYSSYYKICISILKQKNIVLSSTETDKLVYKSNYNFHNLLSELNILNTKNIIPDNLMNNNLNDSFNENIILKDTYDDIEIITLKLLTQEFTLKDILTMCSCDESIIGFNLLENCYSFITKDNLSECLYLIYKHYILSDIMDTFMISNHVWELKDYIILLSSFNINLTINPYRNIRNKNIIYNRYISKSLIIIHSLNQYNTSSFPYHHIMYYLLFSWFHNPIDKYNHLLIHISRIYPKEFIKYVNSFQYFYNIKLNIKTIQKSRQSVTNSFSPLF